MRQKQSTSLQREQLDRKFNELRVAPLNSPRTGWIRAIREGIGMSVAQLAKRMGVPRQNIHRIEQSETAGHVTVATLKKIADQLSCDLYVTFIPKASLQTIVKKRAEGVAKRILDQTQLHMGLEDQKASEDFVKTKSAELADQLIQTSDKRLWEDL
jgi:predicted DNA-binding mobile mystery protein A